MALGFSLVNRRISAGQILERVLAKASTQFTKGDALEFANGAAAPVNAATDSPQGIFNDMETLASLMRPGTTGLSTTAGEKIKFIPCEGGMFIFETTLKSPDAPPIDTVAVNSGSTSTALVTAAGSTSDYIGGTIYFPETDTQHKITGDTVAGGVHTFTFVPLAPRALVSTDHAIAVPFASFSSQAVKLSSTTPSQGISTAVADNTGGKAKIVGVDLKRYKVRVTFPQLT